MRKFVLLTFILSLLTTGNECIAQKQQAVRAIMGKGAIDLYKAIKYNPATPYQSTIPSSAASAANQWRVPVSHYGLRTPQFTVRRDSLLRSVKITNHAELLQRHRKAMLQKAREQLQKTYQELCVEMVQGMLHDTLALVRTANKAIEMRGESEHDNKVLNDMAVNCFKQFILSRPSTPKIATAVKSLMSSSQCIAPLLIDEDIEYRFFKYWESPDSLKIMIPDFETLVELGRNYPSDCRKAGLAEGMLQFFDGDYNSASDWFKTAVLNFLDQPEIFFCQNTLLRVTAYCLSLTERYSELLTLFENEILDQYASKDSYTAFLLYRASLFTGDDRAIKYADMGMAADEKYFMQQFQGLYDGIYAHFIENPQPLSNLDFLFGALNADDLSHSYIDIAGKLIEKLPDTDTPYDGQEHFYDEALTPYRDALLEIADRSDSLHKGLLTPDNAIVKIIAECTNGNFQSSADQGRANIRILFEQLYKQRNNPEYYVTIVLSGYCYSAGLSYQKPKEALKIMNKAVLPTMEKLDEGVNPFRGEVTQETYKYMASLYRRTHKLKKAEKMQKMADEYVIVVE